MGLIHRPTGETKRAAFYFSGSTTLARTLCGLWVDAYWAPSDPARRQDDLEHHRVCERCEKKSQENT